MQSWATIVQSSRTESVMAIFDAKMTNAVLEKTKRVHNVREGPTARQSVSASSVRVRIMARDDGNLAANALSPKSFIAVAWHQ